jgi:hypothetical protein
MSKRAVAQTLLILDDDVLGRHADLRVPAGLRLPDSCGRSSMAERSNPMLRRWFETYRPLHWPGGGMATQGWETISYPGYQPAQPSNKTSGLTGGVPNWSMPGWQPISSRADIGDQVRVVYMRAGMLVQRARIESEARNLTR